MAAAGGETRLVIEEDRTLLRADRAILHRATHRVHREGFALHYDHRTSSEELLLALPDVAAWCWARSGEWRRRMAPVIATRRTV